MGSAMKAVTSLEGSTYIKSVQSTTAKDYLQHIQKYDKLSMSYDRQSDFDKVCIDNRTKSGNLFHSWLQHFKQAVRCNSDENMPPPGAVNAFIKIFAKKVIEEYDVSMDLLSVCELYAENALFCRLGNALEFYNTDHLEILDRRWMKQIEWLVSMTQKQIGIADMYIMEVTDNPSSSRCDSPEGDVLGESPRSPVTSNTPYKATSLSFNDLSSCSSPREMLDVILKSIKVMVFEANYCGKSVKKTDSFDAEAFFPILVYALLHSDIKNIHYCLGFLYNFGNPETTMKGEAAYYLCSLDAAVRWIMQQNAATFPIDITSSPSRRSDSFNLEGVADQYMDALIPANNGIILNHVVDIERHENAGTAFIAKWLNEM
jgi:hypothetical protein